MRTILVAVVILSGWVAMAVDTMRHNDEHMMRVLACMKEARHVMLVSSQEAYVICEKGDK